MITVAEAIQIVKEQTQVLSPERVELEDALSRFLGASLEDGFKRF